MEDSIPLDIRELQDFPSFNTSFQDGPNFRQNLHFWAQKTEKVSCAWVVFVHYFTSICI